MVMRAKDPASDVPRRKFSQDELDYANKRGITEAQLQAVHANAVADGLGTLPFIRIVVCARGGIRAKAK